MTERTSLLISYAAVYTTFNMIIALVYNIYGWIIFKKKYAKLSHSHLSQGQLKYLVSIKFVNVHRNWLKKYYVIIRNYSILYFFLAEILCFAATYLTGKYVLVCRISLFTGIFLLFFLVYLIFYFKKNNKILAEQHRTNLDKAIDDYYAAKDAAEQGAQQGEQ